ncbi:MAG: ATP phosphoribosyltransferase [Gammaproteobacteria bacterium]|nr:ATP phosphoribosyltransferase [Gammaproteobacteria bacterium]
MNKPMPITADRPFAAPDEDRLRIAIQKKGRLTDHSLKLFASCGLNFTRDRDHLVCYGENLPVDLMLVRDDDIPELVAEGICAAGIVGQNVATEHALVNPRVAVDETRVLDFGKCRLSIAVPEGGDIDALDQLAGKRIATTYPGLTRRYLEEQGIDAEVVMLTGAVEIAPRLGKAEAICDLVSTGNTLRANHLVELETIYRSQASVVTTREPLTAELASLLERLLRRMDGVLQVNESKYIMLHAPRDRVDEIRKLLPGAEAPTVLPLEGSDDKVALHAVCRESVFWETLENLKAAGASAVLVLPVEKMLA